MNLTKLLMFFIALACLAACRNPDPNGTHNINPGGYTGANNNTGSAAHTSEHSETHKNTTEHSQNLTEVPRPQKIVEMMAQRGEQDSAKPVMVIREPAANSTINSSLVKVKLGLAASDGELKGYMPMKDPATGMGNHIHVILDNQPYEAYYNLNQDFELRNVSDGEHTLRVFPSRPWHESYKNANAMQMVKFTVKNGGADTTKPATTNSNQTMANANASATPEGKDMPSSTAGAVDATKPLLTYSRPKGEYKGADAENIMIDFWLSNAKLAGDGGEYRVRYSIDGGAAKMLDKWQPIWLSGWSDGKHTIKLDLIDSEGNVVENGGYNSTTREITVTK